MLLTNIFCLSMAVIPAFGMLVHGHGSHMHKRHEQLESNLETRATGGKVSNKALQVKTIKNNDGIGAGQDVYIQYSGNGTNFPPKKRWVSFVDMFNNNKVIMLSSCSQFGQPNDSEAEITNIYNSIQTVAQETLLDHRFILAVMLQESGGCVRAPTTNYGVRNPGLMQDHNGSGTCNSDVTKKVSNPCPAASILTMIREGAAGTTSGDGLAQCMNQANNPYTIAYYKAARIYNSGSVAQSGNLEDGYSTHCYASDIANRLTGWVKATHACKFDG